MLSCFDFCGVSTMLYGAQANASKHAAPGGTFVFLGTTANARKTHIVTPLPFTQWRQHVELRCVLLSDPSTYHLSVLACGSQPNHVSKFSKLFKKTHCVYNWSFRRHGCSSSSLPWQTVLTTGKSIACGVSRTWEAPTPLWLQQEQETEVPCLPRMNSRSRCLA